MTTRFKKYSVVIQGEIFNRDSHQKDQFFHTCRSKTEFNAQINNAYNVALENPELAITLYIRRSNK